MKRYRVKTFLVLGFLTAQEQEDRLFRAANSTNVIIESDGETIWVTENGKREESITQAHAVGMWVEDGILEEIVD